MTKFFAIAAALTLATPAPAATDLFIALGDSITAGTMADSGPPTPASRANRDLTQKRSLSWSAGDQIESHFKRLQGWMAVNEPEVKLDVLNLAVAGSVSQGLASQITEAKKAMASGRYRKLAYVTLLIGANDVCNGVALETYRAHLMETLAQLATLNAGDPASPVRVLMVSLPQIPQLAQPVIKTARTYLGMTCETFRNTLGLCRSMLDWKDDKELRQRLDIVAGFNSAIRDAAQAAPLLYRGLETTYVPGFAEAEMRLEGMAADCFHPNKLGQSELSAGFWATQPWFK